MRGLRCCRRARAALSCARLVPGFSPALRGAATGSGVWYRGFVCVGGSIPSRSRKHLGRTLSPCVSAYERPPPSRLHLACALLRRLIGRARGAGRVGRCAAQVGGRREPSGWRGGGGWRSSGRQRAKRRREPHGGLGGWRHCGSRSLLAPCGGRSQGGGHCRRLSVGRDGCGWRRGRSCWRCGWRSRRRRVSLQRIRGQAQGGSTARCGARR